MGRTRKDKGVKTEPVNARVSTPSASKPARLKQPLDNSREAKAAARKAMWDYRKVTAWPVYRWPLEKRVVEEHTKLHLPKSYLAQAGEDVKTVRPGMDLNQVVHRHYTEEFSHRDRGGMDWVVREGANFVAGDGVLPARHEFLGPDPRVAGYFLDVDGEIYVKWWDSFLQVQWMGESKWSFEVEMNEDGQWVEKED